MKKFNVEWSEIVYYTQEIEAETEEEARELLMEGVLGVKKLVDMAFVDITNVEEV